MREQRPRVDDAAGQWHSSRRREAAVSQTGSFMREEARDRLTAPAPLLVSHIKFYVAGLGARAGGWVCVRRMSRHEGIEAFQDRAVAEAEFLTKNRWQVHRELTLTSRQFLILRLTLASCSSNAAAEFYMYAFWRPQKRTSHLMDLRFEFFGVHSKSFHFSQRCHRGGRR